MPSHYAHYRFGAAVLPKMPADLRKVVTRYRRLYDVGLHGPDFFFFYNPLAKNRFDLLGSQLHLQSGNVFFTRVCRGLRLVPSEEAQAYLYGVLCHYVLDSHCHPLVNAQAELGTAGHTEIEMEFDRFLLELDGKIPPHTQNISRHMVLMSREMQIVARFYPGTTEQTVAIGLKNMALTTRVFATKSSSARKLLSTGVGIVRKKQQDFFIPETPNPLCAHLDEPLLALYQQAEEKFPQLLLQLTSHLTYNAPLDQAFDPIFG
ncbi:MAG: zinc dependent phospholipase C family protein [Oscillospiraceae bacterium]|nr:zinc dependent phospholipase C family protein [Oscillospiraceae bacterium]